MATNINPILQFLSPIHLHKLRSRKVREAATTSTTTAMMTACNNQTPQHDDDIVGINVGGKLKLQVLRSTLCLPPADTMFSRIFAAVSTTSTTAKPVQVLKDEQGLIFLDHDPELIEIIINYLRMKKNEDPFDPIVSGPEYPINKAKDFRRLLHYFDLTAYFHYPTTTSPFIASETLRRMDIDDIEYDSDAANGCGSYVSRDTSTPNLIVGDGEVVGDEVIGTYTPQGYHFCYG